MRRVLLLIPSTSYRAQDFLEAAGRLGVEVTVGSDHEPTLAAHSRGQSVALDFHPIGEGVSRILDHAGRYPLDAVVGTDDETTVLAATASKRLGLAHNDPESVAMVRDKFRFRQALARAGLRSPWFKLLSLAESPATAASSVRYPCVLKPLGWSGSRGIIRADDQAGFVAAFQRIARLLSRAESVSDARHRDSILVEGFLPGQEVALEGLLNDGSLRPLALFDKPDPLDGPFFEETIYVTPSRLSRALQRDIVAEVDRAASALGLRSGPLHAELRIDGERISIIELAARSIGGLCSRTLEFSAGLTLEELILRHALELPTDPFPRRSGASGVMMIPIPRAGTLRAVEGLDAARAVPAIDGVTISIPIGDTLVPLPEGDRYLGFIFATAAEPEEAAAALRAAHQRLHFAIGSGDASS